MASKPSSTESSAPSDSMRVTQLAARHGAGAAVLQQLRRDRRRARASRRRRPCPRRTTSRTWTMRQRLADEGGDLAARSGARSTRPSGSGRACAGPEGGGASRVGRAARRGVEGGDHDARDRRAAPGRAAGGEGEREERAADASWLLVLPCSAGARRRGRSRPIASGLRVPSPAGRRAAPCASRASPACRPAGPRRPRRRTSRRPCGAWARGTSAATRSRRRA